MTSQGKSKKAGQQIGEELFDSDYFDLGPSPIRPPPHGLRLSRTRLNSPYLENLPCEKHSWNGGAYGPCRDCINEAREAAHAKKLQAWERFRDLADLLKGLVPATLRGCVTDEEILLGAQVAMKQSKAALALLDAEQPEAGPVPARTEG